jgi:hypothetical protein
VLHERVLGFWGFGKCAGFWGGGGVMLCGVLGGGGVMLCRVLGWWSDDVQGFGVLGSVQGFGVVE